jgi:hypothetical protein
MNTASPAAVSGQKRHPAGQLVIRPAGPDDQEAIAQFLASLSLQTRSQRFQSGSTPPARLLRILSGEDGADVVIALCGQAVVGHAMAARRPAGGGPPDVGLVVTDSHQGLGAGPALMAALARRLADCQIREFTVHVQADNHRAMTMISRCWPQARWDWTEPAQATVTVPLRPIRGRRAADRPQEPG